MVRDQKRLDILAQKQVSDKEVEELLRNYGEKSRLYRRDVFTANDWIRYRRPDRFVDHLLSIYDSGLLRALQFEMLVLTTLSTVIVIYNDLFVDGIQGLDGQIYPPLAHLPALQLPLVPFTLSTAALGLLLTFRTNVSYSRWNEARTAWGAVINDSRSIVRMGCIWARSYNNIDDVSLQRLGEAVCSFSRTLMNRTLPTQEDATPFAQYTHTQISDARYAQALRQAQHRPTAALAEITQILVDFKLNPIHQVEVERVITSLCNALGASERIFTSPVPTFYTRHTARFLAVWLFCLPLGMYDSFGSTWNHLGLIPGCFFLGLFLLGIEELATQMEEPFSILPMEQMCAKSIRNPIMEQVERSSRDGEYLPDTIIPVDNYPPEFVFSAPSKVRTVEEAPPSMPAEEESPSINDNYFAVTNGGDGGTPPKLAEKMVACEFGIDHVVNGLDATSCELDDETDVVAGDALTDFYVSQPNIESHLQGSSSFYEPQPFASQSLNYGGMPGKEKVSAKASTYMPTSYKPSSGSGMASYLDNFNDVNGAVTNGAYETDILAPEEPTQHDKSYMADSYGQEPLSYGGMPRASTAKSSSSSYMPTSYKPTSGSGMASYFDNLNGGSYTTPPSSDNESQEEQSQPLNYGGMPRAHATKPTSSSSYMPSSYKISSSGMPSYFDNFDNAAGHSSEEEIFYSSSPPPPNNDHAPRPPTSNTRPPSSYMPKSYRPTSGSGMPSYFDNF